MIRVQKEYCEHLILRNIEDDKMPMRRDKYTLGVRLIWEIFPNEFVKSFFDEWSVKIRGQSKQLKEFQLAFQGFMNSGAGNKLLVLYDSDNVEFNESFVGIDVFKLYLDWLTKMIFEWLDENGVQYYYINIEGGNSPECMRGRPEDFYLYERGRNPVIMPNGIPGWYLSDRDMDGYHVVGGVRKTCSIPDEYTSTCYMLGACVTLGSYTRDEETIESMLQEELNNTGKKVRILNYSCGSNSDVIVSAINTFHRVLSLKLASCDTLIFFDKDSTLSGVLPYLKERNKRLDLKDFFGQHIDKNIKCFKDNEWYHINRDGNEIITEELLHVIDFKVQSANRQSVVPPVCDKKIDTSESFIAKAMQDYFKRVAKERMPFANTGAIVMNCNPFTKGHLYLVEQASKQVEFLYVFVVEEDKSYFSFKDRFAMAQKNCQRFDNVKVLPSGTLMISSYTFAEYFEKDKIQDEEISTTNDVNIFGSFIAPFFRIKKRFVGTEPFDNVTRQYNETMKMYLSDFGIELVEIERLKDTDNYKVISATAVRHAIDCGDDDILKSLLPIESYEYLAVNGLLR